MQAREPLTKNKIHHFVLLSKGKHIGYGQHGQEQEGRTAKRYSMMDTRSITLNEAVKYGNIQIQYTHWYLENEL
jgi:hypothetical protein